VARPRLRGAIPILPSPDLEATRRFYGEHLGFRLLFARADYAALSRDGVELHFWRSEDPRLPPLSSCRIEVDGIDRLYAEMQAQGVVHPQGAIADKPWGTREFVVLDGHGNAITFAEDTTGGLA
jgi:catechol 2,3-dioxygenase-like lactoylglutathione lyase family enzyme